MDNRAAMERLHCHYQRLARQHAEPALRGERGLRQLLRMRARWHIGPLYWALRALGRHVRSHPQRLRQLVQVPWFAAELRIDPESYYRHRIYLQWDRRRDYIFHDEIVAVLQDINARLSPQDAADLGDKRSFHRRCVGAGLPTIPVLAEFERGAAAELDADPRAWARDLFSKYANRYCGEGVSLWRFDGSRYHSEGLSLDVAALRHHLAAASATYPVMLQPKISNARAIVPISGKGVSTARIVTVRRPGGQPEVAIAAYRMATGEQVADNFTAGGIGAPIDLATGALGVAMLKRVGGDEPIRHHPDSGAPIEGFTLPRWEDAKALAVAAHRSFATMASVGWDVALTDDGPLLVEGNDVWGVDLAQISHRRPLGDSIIPQALVEHLDALALRDQA